MVVTKYGKLDNLNVKVESKDFTNSKQKQNGEDGSLNFGVDTVGYTPIAFLQESLTFEC